MASVFLDTLMIRHGPRWHPMAKQFTATNQKTWQSTYSGGVMPTPLSVWGQKPPTDRRNSKRISHQGTNSWFKTTDVNSPRLPSRFPVDGADAETYRLRPTIRRQTQIPGRYFPKPSLTDQERVLLAAKTGRPLSGSFLLSNKYHEIKKLASKISSGGFPDTHPTRPTSSCNQKIASTRRTLFDHNDNVAKSEVYMISFRDEDTGAYDPNSELHSDYYTVKRQVRFAPVRQVSMPQREGLFGDVICGKSKRIHNRG